MERARVNHKYRNNPEVGYPQPLKTMHSAFDSETSPHQGPSPIYSSKNGVSNYTGGTKVEKREEVRTFRYGPAPQYLAPSELEEHYDYFDPQVTGQGMNLLSDTRLTPNNVKGHYYGK